DVKAHVQMDTKKRMKYNFEYTANVADAVIEAKDSTGWTNRSGARKYDWEYEALTRGHELNITNNLRDFEWLAPEAGPNDDWLPCCYSGTIPEIEQLNVAWPSDVVKATLAADSLKSNMRLKSKDLISPRNIGLINSNLGINYPLDATQKIGMLVSLPERQYLPSRIENVKVASMPGYPIKGYQKIGMIASIPEITSVISSPASDDKVSDPREPCEGDSCSGESCISTFGEKTYSTSSEEFKQGDIRNIHVDLFVWERRTNATAPFRKTSEDPAKEEIYNITILNNGDVTLDDVQVSLVMPEGMLYGASEYDNTAVHGRIREPKIDPENFNKLTKTGVAWNIGTLNSEEQVSIILRTYIKFDDNVDNKAVSVKVEGNAPGDLAVRDSTDNAIALNCTWINEEGTDLCSSQIEGPAIKARCRPDCSQKWEIP
ncbi:MAG: hypothetical protein PHQ34_12510, partial [Methanothrix sp.]|nr:hypothetical protein [Methanothrix sp.]